MTTEFFQAALRGFSRRRPFVPYIIEFTSGSQQKISHPEAIRQETLGYVVRLPNRCHVVFTADDVCRLFDTNE